MPQTIHNAELKEEMGRLQQDRHPQNCESYAGLNVWIEPSNQQRQQQQLWFGSQSKDVYVSKLVCRCVWLVGVFIVIGHRNQPSYAMMVI